MEVKFSVCSSWIFHAFVGSPVAVIEIVFDNPNIVLVILK